MSGERRGSRAGGHESWDELAVGWALHALEPGDEADFVRHLPDCGRCARTVAETAEVMGSLANDLPETEPSPGLHERLRDAVAHTEQVGNRPPPPRPPDSIGIERELGSRREPARAAGFPSYEPGATIPPLTAHAGWRGGWRPGGAGWAGWRSRWPVALMAAAVAVIAALGAWNVVLATSQSDARATAAHQAQVIDDLLRPGQATIAPLENSKGHAVATVVARTGHVQVVTYGLPENDRQATTYVLWGMGKGAPRSLGTFDVVSPDLDLRTVRSNGSGGAGFATYGISIEPGRHAPPAPTDVVAQGKVTS